MKTFEELFSFLVGEGVSRKKAAELAAKIFIVQNQAPPTNVWPTWTYPNIIQTKPFDVTYSNGAIPPTYGENFTCQQ